jgi:hypothetical protein
MSLPRTLALAREYGVCTALSLIAAKHWKYLAWWFAAVLAGFALLVGANSSWPLIVLGICTALGFEIAVLIRGCVRNWAHLQQLLDWHKIDGSAPEGQVDLLKPSKSPLFGPAVGMLLAVAAFLMTIFALGYHVSWELPRVRLDAYQQKVGILVTGDWEFQKKVCAALQLLESKAPARLDFVKDHISVVIQNDQAQGQADISVDPPVVALDSDTVSDLQWSAAALVHEAMHIQQARESRRRHGGSMIAKEVVGTAVETAANRAQIETLQELGAPPDWIGYISRDQGAHWVTHVGVSNATFLEQHDVPFTPMELREKDQALWRKLQDFRRKR